MSYTMYLSDLTAEHVRRLLSYDPETGIFLWLTSRRGTWHIGKRAGSFAQSGYVGIWIDGRSYLAHRLAWLHVHGVWPTEQIDHINGNGYDNRLINLREATRSTNGANMKLIRTNRLKGVSQCRTRWQARITKDQKTMHLGTFATPQEAHAVYVKAAKELFGEYACDGVHVEPSEITR